MKLLLISASLALAINSGYAFVLPSSQSRCSVSRQRTFLAATSDAACEPIFHRRAFLSTGMAAVAAAIVTATTDLPRPAFADGVDYKAVSNDIADLIKANPDWGPTMVRLAWHSSGTYDKMTKTGGSEGGTIRFEQELKHPNNAGLAVTAVPWLEPIHDKYAASGLSYADLYTLAGGKL